jgi:hypothetical protein
LSGSLTLRLVGVFTYDEINAMESFKVLKIV